MRGDMVIVRAFRGVPLVRRIWEEVEHGVYITDDAHFELLMAGKTTIPPVGFPREDVFKYDPKLEKEVDRLFEAGKWDWSKLEVYEWMKT